MYTRARSITLSSRADVSRKLVKPTRITYTENLECYSLYKPIKDRKRVTAPASCARFPIRRNLHFPFQREGKLKLPFLFPPAPRSLYPFLFHSSSPSFASLPLIQDPRRVHTVSSTSSSRGRTRYRVQSLGIFHGGARSPNRSRYAEEISSVLRRVALAKPRKAKPPASAYARTRSRRA